MEITLCCGKRGCPKVHLDKDLVTIGEENNLVKLKLDEWNKLVKLIEKRKIGKI